MKNAKPRQLSLFTSQSPEWESLPREPQQAILDVLSWVLLDMLEQHPNETINNSNFNEDNHVS
ncbi:MAG TPA: hypothetical protein QF564_20090 [Pirellulaceae bacterium]|jgi:hypothetical protein|nr:hypothetical protein [Pirellulaceae bacterium]